VAPFWLPGLAFGGWYVVSEIRERIYEARHYFTLDKAREVDGIAFPAGTWVALDEDEALKEAELPAGETVRLRAAAWQGKLEFAAPAHAPNAAHGRITDGTLATPAELDGIPCRAGDRATFFWSGRLMECPCREMPIYRPRSPRQTGPRRSGNCAAWPATRYTWRACDPLRSKGVGSPNRSMSTRSSVPRANGFS